MVKIFTLRRRASFDRTRWLDFGFVSALLLTAAAPAIIFRPQRGLFGNAFYPLLADPGGRLAVRYSVWLVGWFIVGISMAIVWHRTMRRSAAPPPERAAARHEGRGHVLRIVTIALLYILLTIMTFYIPMRKNFWHGFDDPGNLTSGDRSAIDTITSFDYVHSRPLALWTGQLAALMSRDTVDGYLWVVLLEHGLTGLMLYGLLRECLPQSRGIAWLAALLSVASPADLLRYKAIVLVGYYGSVCSLFAALWLYVRSYTRQQRWLLVMACALLVSALLAVEAGYLVAAFAPLLLIVLFPRRKHLLTWVYAWLGTVGVLAIRFVLFFIQFPGSYQGNVARQALNTLDKIMHSLGLHFRPVLSYFDGLGVLPRYLLPFVLVLVSATVLLWLATRSESLGPGRRRLTLMLFCVAGGVVLAILPYLPFTGVYRTQLFAAPLHAAFWAILIGLLGTFLPGRVKHSWLAIVGSILIAASTVHSLHFQDTAPRTLSFERVTYTFQKVHETAPNLLPNTLLLFVRQNGATSPFGCMYNLWFLSRLVLGVESFLANFDDPCRHPAASFAQTGITVPSLVGTPPVHYPYSQIIIFTLEQNDDVVLAEEVPSDLLPPGIAAEGYNPRARIVSGVVTPLRFLRYTHWMTPFKPS